MLETEKPITKIDNHRILKEASEFQSCLEMRFLAIWAHKHAGKHIVSTNNC